MTDDDIIALADATRDQYFLTAPEKLALLVGAAGIRTTDHVVEVGAGIGTVARTLPPCASLTLIELDGRFRDILRANVPNARVIQGDALLLLPDLRCDVLLSNLPRSATESLIALLPALPPRTAVLAVGEDTSLDNLAPEFICKVITTIGGDDFRPPQPAQSRLVKAIRVTGGSALKEPSSGEPATPTSPKACAGPATASTTHSPCSASPDLGGPATHHATAFPQLRTLSDFAGALWAASSAASAKAATWSGSGRW